MTHATAPTTSVTLRREAPKLWALLLVLAGNILVLAVIVTAMLVVVGAAALIFGPALLEVV